jgi:hypothetical protein
MVEGYVWLHRLRREGALALRSRDLDAVMEGGERECTLQMSARPLRAVD